MKDEIKENNSVMKCCVCNNENIGEFIVIEDKKYHLNCINNLQEENEHLQKQNKGLNNLIFQHIDEEDNLIDYKSRNEKAIEYIRKYVPIIDNNLFTKEHQLKRYKEKEKYNENFINDLLNILNGGDEK